jgi:hypothetical protein
MEQAIPDKEVLQETLHQILRYWHRPELFNPGVLSSLRLYVRLSAQPEKSFTTPSQQLIGTALEILQGRNEAAALLLRQRYLDNLGTKKLSREMAVSESQFYNLQSEALSQLANIVLELEQKAQFEHRLAVETRLEPLAHQQLFGIDELQKRLYTAVVAPETPWLIAVEGLGGIGKTSLADRLARTVALASRFYDIAWVSARQEFFLPAAGIRPAPGAVEQPALTIEALTDILLVQLDHSCTLTISPQEKAILLHRLLKERAYLIVVDNLETVADYQALIPSLRQLANPSKFLLTSRHSLRAYADIFCLNVTELSQADALALLSYEARLRDLAPLIQATPSQLASIYEVVGGNPLALKLVLGQIHALPLFQVLENLKQAQGRKITELYTYIYWQSWQALSDAGKQALLALPLASPRGSTLTHLAAVSELELGELSQAVEELITFSLVEVGGDLDNRRYSIHRLTETFLLTEITRWTAAF